MNENRKKKKALALGGLALVLAGLITFIVLYTKKNSTPNTPYTQIPTNYPIPYNISKSQPIYEIIQGFGLVKNSIQFGFLNGLPVIQFCDNDLNYSIVKFFGENDYLIRPDIIKIPTKNPNGIIASEMIDKNININYGLSINSFEIGLYNGNPSINFIDSNYVSRQLEFILTPNTASPNGNLFK